MTKNYFITIEGIEGAGKSSAVTVIEKFLQEKRLPYVLTREPGGTKIAEQIRNLLLEHNSEQMCSDAELLLLFAARAQHLQQLIIPALDAGKWVISDRFTDASYAYQGAGRGISWDRVSALENWVQGDLRPDITILLDIDPEEGLKRAASVNVLDRIESEKIEFFREVRASYLRLARENQKRFQVVDATQSVDEVGKQIIEILTALM
ncbi:MAG: dTMP kinase [Gammaproteobacteria bacterium]|nr:dTMP kinase [Gammaproteobacteria bacterium]